MVFIEECTFLTSIIYCYYNTRHTIHSSIRVEQLESTLSQALTRVYSNYRSTLHNDQQSNFQNWMPELRQCVIRHNTSVFSLFARCSPPPCIQQNQKRIMMISPHMISYDGAERPKVIYIGIPYGMRPVPMFQTAVPILSATA